MSHRLITRGFVRLAVVAGMAISAGGAYAAGVTVMVTDAGGAPVADAIVYADVVGGPAPHQAHKPAAIEQKGRRFLPMVTVVQTGTEISFPNNDSVRHHVYSFSPAKVFELKLYSGTPGSPVMFDKPGPVVVGCNIHDQMVAFIHVVDTPYFAHTDASGKAQIDNVPPGKYTLKFWYYKTPSPAQIQEQPLLMKAADATATFKVIAKPAAEN